MTPTEGHAERRSADLSPLLLLMIVAAAAAILLPVWWIFLNGWQIGFSSATAFAASISAGGAAALLLLMRIRTLRHSERALRTSEERYRLLYESANDAIVLINREHAYVDCNPAALRLFDVPGKQYLVGRKVGDFSPPVQPSFESHEANWKRIDDAFSGKPQLFEWAMLSAGKLHYNEIILSRVIVDGEPLLLGIFRDINARKHVEALHAGQNRILHMIGTGIELPRILTAIIEFVEASAPHGRGMMLQVAQDQSAFTSALGPNLPPQLLATMAGMPIRKDHDSSSEAVLSRCPVLVENLETEPVLRGLQAMAGKNRFAGCGSWPIMGRRGQILGILSILYHQHANPDAEHLHLIGICTDLASIAIESRKSEEQILLLAHYDELTGLPNRFLYTQHVEKALAHAERHGEPVGVLFLDLDRFKNINDTFGHEIGDAVLRDMSVRLRASLRDSDIIARVGGDEFIVLVEDLRDPLELSDVAQRLLIEACKPFEIGGNDYQLSVSIGIASYPLDGLDAHTLLKNADIAMYRAKSTGRNNYQFYSSEMNTHTIERLGLEGSLRRAIERREFVMHYQPKIDLLSGRVVGAEALVRWNHPERGLLFPGEFIPLAEEAGLIGTLGLLVLDTTCSDIVAFKNAGISFGRVAINLSGGQFNGINLLHDVMQVVDSWCIDPASLEFEITESMVMHNRDQAIELMDDIRALGFTLSIDDFGTGYSSLAYLKRFPVDSIKIDKSFINDIPHDPNDSAIVLAIIMMAHTLGLKVTAEGVETALQLETLRNFACDECQGYHFSKAIPANEFIAYVRHSAAPQPEAALQ